MGPGPREQCVRPLCPGPGGPDGAWEARTGPGGSPGRPGSGPAGVPDDAWAVLRGESDGTVA
jgi:hypothetical protein